MSWDTSFESTSGEIHETSSVRLGGEAPPRMVEQLMRAASDLPVQAMADGVSSLASSRVTRSNKDAELSKYVLLQGRGENAVGRFAVIGVFNTATDKCVFWKKYDELAAVSPDDSSAASSSRLGGDHGRAVSTPVLPRASAAVTPSTNVRSPAAAAASSDSAVNLARAADSARYAGSAMPTAGGVTSSTYAGHKRMRATEGAESDEFLIEQAIETALLESAAAATVTEAAERERVQQVKAASTEAAAAMVANDAAKEAMRAATSAAALLRSKAAAMEADADAAAAVADAAAIAARQVKARATEARAAAEAEAVSLRNLEAVHLRTEEALAAAMRRFNELT